MLPTFVIGLREGLEAALIVGIVAAFLRKQGRRDLLRWVFVGVGTAVAICALAGAALEIYSRNLPQRQQEGLETVVGALAVCMVTYMVVWMRRHSRELKGQLEGLAADAITGHSRAGRAMVLMAFLAVIREGLETVVFLIAAFNETGSSTAAGAGATLGIAVAVALGYGIYRGGVRINLSKFFRATGLVLVLVAAGLVVNALHTAHEAGWLDAGQGRTVDLSWLVSPGSVQASLLTGMLGIQQHPVTIEAVGWLVYLIPVGLYVAWPPGRRVPTWALARAAAATAVLGGAAALGLTLAAPAAPRTDPRVFSHTAGGAVVRLTLDEPLSHRSGPVTLHLTGLGRSSHAGVDAAEYVATLDGTAANGQPAELPAAQVAALNGGRLPIGVPATAGRLATTYRDTVTVHAWLDPRTGRLLDLRADESVLASVSAAGRTVALNRPVAAAGSAFPAATVRTADHAARADAATLDDRSLLLASARWCAILAGLAVLVAAGAVLARRRRGVDDAVPAPVPAAIAS